ncbi:MAG: hypothetical protein HY829_05380 [Actinobacteria bacterium]|nr:hypothetical protein [Actinomycetota bacterium]
MSLSDVADELYGMDPGNFVARRTELVKQARSSGDKALATQIGALRRPTVSAWYLNLLARSGAPELDALIDLGATMREAQSRLDMGRVASLTPERQQRENAVLHRVEALLSSRGITPSPAAWDEVSGTLSAVAADASAAAAVRSGCLARALEYAGFGEVDLSGAVAAELEARADRGASPRSDEAKKDQEGERPAMPPASPPTPAAPRAPDRKRERLLTQARARLADAAEERRDAEREVEELGLAYATAQERLRTAEAAETKAQSALESLDEHGGEG